MALTLGVLLASVTAASELPEPWQATASSNADEALLAIDGDRLTAWRSDAPQTLGDFLQIDLGATRVVQQVRVETGRRYPAEFPRALAVTVSANGRDFQEVTAVENLNRRELRLRFNPVVARHIRLELVGSSGYRWAVSEVQVFGAADLDALNDGDAVVISDDAPPIVRFAAEDLRDYLSEATSNYLSLVTDDASERYPGVRYAVGRNALTEGKLAALDGLMAEAILLRKTGNTVVVAGNTPRATAFAVYRLLHRLGVRWYSPGEWGEHVPELDAVNLDGLDVVHEPSIELRRISSVRMDHLEADVSWTIRNCLSYVNRRVMHHFEERTGISWTPALVNWPYGHYPHSFQRLVPESALKEHPDMKPMLDGERKLYESRRDNFCTSSPEAVELVSEKALAWFGANPQSRSFSICPQDGARWCECERCRVLDEPLTMENFSRHEMRNVSDRFFTFINQVAERVARDFPDRLITTIAYANWHQPPRFDVHPNVLVNVCQYGCSSHAVNDPSCERVAQMRRRMLGWRERVAHLGVYDYVLLNTTAPRTPHPYGRSVPHEIQWLASDLEVTSWWSETAGAFWQWSPAPFWLATQMAWDASQDPEALLEEFMAQYYGPADGAREYWSIMRRRVQQGGVHYGSYNNTPRAEMFTPETIEALDVALRRAEAEVAEYSVYAKRVSMLRESLEFVRQYPMQED